MSEPLLTKRIRARHFKIPRASMNKVGDNRPFSDSARKKRVFASTVANEVTLISITVGKSSYAVFATGHDALARVGPSSKSCPFP